MSPTLEKVSHAQMEEVSTLGKILDFVSSADVGSTKTIRNACEDRHQMPATWTATRVFVEKASPEAVTTLHGLCQERLPTLKSSGVSKASILTFLSSAPEADIRAIYQECAKKLSFGTGGSDDDDVPGGIFMTNASDILSADEPTSMPSRSASIVQQLKQKVESNDQLSDLAPPDMEATIVAVSTNTKYASPSTDFRVLDEKVKEYLNKKRDEAKKAGIRFPWALAPGEPLLRVSKCSQKEGKKLKVVLTFHPYSMANGSGISCYLKK